MACITLPPAPPPPPPPPPGSPPPPAPSPTPPAPPPVGMPPAAPPGTPQIVLDLRNSYVEADSYCYGRRYFPEINTVYGAQVQATAEVALILQNLSSTDSGSVAVQLTMSNAGLIVAPAGIQTVTVTPGNTLLVSFTLDGSSVGAGWFVVTVDIGGNKSTFNLVTTGVSGCDGGGGGG